MPETLTCLIRTLAPVHLGSGEVYEPLGFVIDERKPCLVAFEPGDFLNLLPEADRRRFLEICRRGTIASLLEIYNFYYERRYLAQGRLVSVCPGLVAQYRDVVKTRPDSRDLKQTINQFTIHRTAFLAHDHRPYIPGSAIKGALRTAYLNALAQQKTHIKSNPKEKGAASKLERELLGGSFTTDPFRLLKVSDFLPVGNIKTKIVYAIYEKKDKSPSKGIYQILEIIEPGEVFHGTLTVEGPRDEIAKFFSGRFLTLPGLWEAARDFFLKENKLEKNYHLQMGLKEYNFTLPNDACLLRLGRHSGAESVTIAGHRRIKISPPGERPLRFASTPTTLWFSSDNPPRNKTNLRPFGWVSLEKLTPDRLALIKERERFWEEESKYRKGSASDEVLSALVAATNAEAATRSIPPPSQEVWEGAYLSYEKGKHELLVTWRGKRARVKGLKLVPPELRESLSGKKAKGVKVNVIVEVEGNAYRIISIQIP